MFDCVSKTPLLPVMKKGTNYVMIFIVLYNFISCPVLIGIKQTLHYKVAAE